MPNFLEAFHEEAKSLPSQELRKVLLQSIADEYEAATRYLQVAEATVSEDVKKIMKDVAKEEFIHAGEFKELLRKLFPEVLDYEAEGREEAKMKLSEKKIDSQKKTRLTIVNAKEKT